MKLIWLLLLAGCASQMTEAEQEQADYERIEYIRTYFVPAYNNCTASGGFVVYDGPISIRIRNILDKKDWERLHRSELINFKCEK